MMATHRCIGDAASGDTNAFNPTCRPVSRAELPDPNRVLVALEVHATCKDQPGTRDRRTSNNS
jgi:hypothetical protein